jgi:peptidoglycan/xylan/chitin deacetylase (PgdA/CDA1 family)
MLRTILSTLVTRFYLLAALFFTASLQASPQHQAIVLQYHHVSDSTPVSTSISPEAFIQHLELIEQLGFQVLPLPKILERIQQGLAFKQDTLGISFDDGYLSIYENAFPELKKRGLPFTIFVSPKAIDNHYGNSLSWEQLKEMQDNGATIANHSLDHDHLLARKGDESLNNWQKRIQQNISAAQQRLIIKLKTPYKLFAYPYGEFNHHLQDLLKVQGFSAFSQQSGPISSYSHMQALPRFPASGPYARIETLSVKLKSLAFKIIGEKPKSEIIKFAEAAPTLDLTLMANDVNHKHLQCFYLGEKIETRVIKNKERLELTAYHNKSLKAGRSRYNCTAPSLSQNRYYWYSMPFVVLNEQGNIE